MPERVRHDRAEVVARVASEHERLDALVRRLQPGDWERPVARRETDDAWTVKDAIAHVVFWKAHSARVFRGERPPADERGLTVNQLNHLVYERWRDRSPDEVVAWHRRVHEEVLRALAEAPEDRFGRLRSPSWPDDLDGHSADHRRRDVEPLLP